MATWEKVGIVIGLLGSGVGGLLLMRNYGVFRKPREPLLEIGPRPDSIESALEPTEAPSESDSGGSEPSGSTSSQTTIVSSPETKGTSQGSSTGSPGSSTLQSTG